MSIEIDKPFDLEKTKLEELSEIITRALTHFEENPKACWTQLPMEKPLWETLQQIVEKQIPKKPTLHRWYECPSCKSGFGATRETPNPKAYKYCYHCGQKLNWD